jgi:hypothetical protein
VLPRAIEPIVHVVAAAAVSDPNIARVHVRNVGMVGAVTVDPAAARRWRCCSRLRRRRLWPGAWRRGRPMRRDVSAWRLRRTRPLLRLWLSALPGPLIARLVLGGGESGHCDRNSEKSDEVSHARGDVGSSVEDTRSFSTDRDTLSRKNAHVRAWISVSVDTPSQA